MWQSECSLSYRKHACIELVITPHKGQSNIASLCLCLPHVHVQGPGKSINSASLPASLSVCLLAQNCQMWRSSVNDHYWHVGTFWLLVPSWTNDKQRVNGTYAWYCLVWSTPSSEWGWYPRLQYCHALHSWRTELFSLAIVLLLEG